MTALWLEGSNLASRLRLEAAQAAGRFAARGSSVVLAVVSATDDEASVWYVRSLVAAAGKVGIDGRAVDLGAAASPDSIAQALTELSSDPAVHGIVLQTPLPPNVRQENLVTLIDPAKDVDGMNPVSLGRLTVGLPAFAPATAAAVMRLLDSYGIELSGRRAVIVGRSVVVGKPLAVLLLSKDATVTISHSRTTDLPSVTREADVLIVAAGKRALIQAEHVKAGAVVIDVGTNANENGGLVGDVDAASVSLVASALSPVPGGVGPVTIATLLLHAAEAAEKLVQMLSDRAPRCSSDEPATRTPRRPSCGVPDRSEQIAGLPRLPSRSPLLIGPVCFQSLADRIRQVHAVVHPVYQPTSLQ
jgi:methylenetetrahydrofolate dehydrogenase (NADP+) / methenyltetrahydrofolate cyclohydrolase